DETSHQTRRNKQLKWEDYEWVRENCHECSAVGVQFTNQADLEREGVEFPEAQIMGVSANMQDIGDKIIADGRFISNDDVAHSALVCVIGADVKEKFFANIDPIGRTLKIRGMPMRVIGREEARGAFFGNSFDRQVYIPVTTHMQIFG